METMTYVYLLILVLPVFLIFSLKSKNSKPQVIELPKKKANNTNDNKTDKAA